MKSWPMDRFPFRLDRAHTPPVLLRVITCGACGEFEELHDGMRRGAAPEWCARKFAQLGWDVGRRAQNDRCPKCASKKENEMTKPTAPLALVTPDPPRSPTREDKRKIVDALEAAYLPDKECYAKDGSDKKLSEQLKMPRAWVSDVREQLFGPDVSEAHKGREQSIERLTAQATSLEERALQLATEAESLRQQVARLRVDVAYA